MDTMDLPQVDIRLLGPVAVAVGGRDVVIGSPKQRVVLAMLALSHRVSLDALAEELWRETPPASVAATVHTLVSRLRRALEVAGGGVTIHSDAGSYVMDLDRCRVDVARFQELVAAGRQRRATGSPDEAVQCLLDALALWRGAALADLADRDFARVAAVRLDGARLDAAEELADAELAAGRPAAALDVIEPLVAEHPFRERLRSEQVVALYRLGRQAEALAAYQGLRRSLADELGLVPTPALQTLERQILRQDPELDGPAAPPPDGARVEVVAPPEELLSGTLAFLFTDIEASTRRWEGDRTAMAADLARHDAVLAEVVAAHHGKLFTHTGDGLGAAFPTVPDALGAALHGQRGLAAVCWTGATPLQVRMAIHAGTAEYRAGTFLGPTLNRTARLLDQAVGGQILCSQAAADLARDELPGGITLGDVGELPLEGLSRPERVWLVLHSDLPAPSSSTPPVADDRGPGPLTSFVGREGELAELAALLGETRLLTITGVGGAGKTRLALELAARAEKCFADGAGIIELATVRDDRPLAGDALSALGVDTGPPSGSAAEEQLCRVLARRQMLLVLDNCEHVLEAAASLVDTVLRRCPRITILVTSREVLSLAGEVAWAAPGLSLPPVGAANPADLEGSDAAALFIARARTAQPGFGAVPNNVAAIARICRRLDGIPLALELAAARVRVLSAPQLADRLDDRLRLLTSGPRSAPARHQTLRATMDWSYELLTDPEQRILRRLAVFPQDFDLEAAAALAGDDADPIDVLDLLARLVDKSLLIPEGAVETARYRLLETVRQYATEKLADAGETDETRKRHRGHFVGRVLAAFRESVPFYRIEWARQWAADSENHNAALGSALTDDDLEAATVTIAGAGYSWYWGTPVASVMASVDPDALTSSEPSLHVLGLISLVFAGLGTGRWDVDRAVAIHEQVLALADQKGSPEDQSWARYYLGYYARSKGDSATARAWLEDALAVADTFDYGRFNFHYELGWIELTEGCAAAAGEHFRSALHLAEAWPGSEIQTVHSRPGLALVEAVEGHTALARSLADRSVEEARTIGFPGILVMALVRSAEVAAIAGEPTRPELPEVLRLLRDQGALRWVASALTVAAFACEAEGHADVAARLLGGAAGVAAALGEDPLPLPAMATVVAELRQRIEAALGSSRVAEMEGAGSNTSATGLLELALDTLDR